MTGRLRILLLTNHRQFKIHYRAYPWARELAARGHKVDVMCHADTERWRTRVENVDGFRLIHSPDLMVGALRQGWDLVCAMRRRNMLFREHKNYDVIHCLDTRPAVILPALAYARATRTTIVSDWVDWWGRGGLISERRPLWYQCAFGWFETYFEEHYRARLDGLTAISSALIDRAVSLGVSPQRCLRIPGGANTRAFSRIPDRDFSRKRLGISSSASVLCFSGLDVLIDLPLVLQTYRHLLRKQPSAVLLLVGPTENHVRTIVPELSLLRGIVATGPKPYEQLPDYLAAADVFLMPYRDKVSNRGRWPNKIGDYMCVGRPTVSNPVGEVKWLFERFDIGRLVQPEPDSMAAVTLSLLENPALAAEIGRRARRVAHEHFAWEKLIVELEHWYHGTIAIRQRGASEAATRAERVEAATIGSRYEGVR